MDEAEVRAHFAQLGFAEGAWDEFKSWILHQAGLLPTTYYKHDVERFVLRVQERIRRS